MTAPKNTVIWLDRKFKFHYEPAMYAIVIDRLRGAPARLEETVAGAPETKLTTNPDGWSVKNQIWHLCMVELLWEKRLEDFREGRDTLFAAQFEMSQNAPDHNDTPIEELLAKFRSKRADIVRQFEQFTIEDAAKTAFHPRLKEVIRLVDHAEFAAEHDDHHISRIHDLVRD